MNAAALLQSQGWRGKGFSLHPTDNSIGLAKPLLISRNTDGRGIGTKQHYTSDQWWLSAFDQKLKGLDTSQKGTVTQSVTSGKLDAASSAVGTGVYGKYTGTAGLYASFVKGGLLEGSVEIEISSQTATPASGSDAGGEKRRETWREQKLRRAREKAAKAEKIQRKERERAAKKEEKRAERERRKRAGETKEERKLRKQERRARKEERRIRREKKQSKER